MFADMHLNQSIDCKNALKRDICRNYRYYIPRSENLK